MKGQGDFPLKLILVVIVSLVILAIFLKWTKTGASMAASARTGIILTIGNMLGGM